MASKRTRPVSERGVILIWVALFMLTMLSFISLGIDLAKLTTTRAQLQNAADAAALAGASAIDPQTGVLVQATAVARAQQTSAQNKAFIDTPQPVVLDASDVTFPTSSQVRVTVRREGANSIVTYFGKALGITSLQMKASATAKVDTVGAVNCGILPLGASLNPGETFQTGCSHIYALKLGSGTGGNGNYSAIAFPQCNAGPCAGQPSTGASTYGCLLRQGYCCEIKKGEVVSTEPGNMAGPTNKAINDRFDADIVKAENICYSDYLAQGGNGQRVIIVPITTQPANGRSDVTILDFASFFLRNRPGSGNDCQINAEYVYTTVPGSGGGSSTGPVVFTIRLVN